MNDWPLLTETRPRAGGKDFGTDGNPVAASLPEFAVEAMKEAMPHLGRKLKGI